MPLINGEELRESFNNHVAELMAAKLHAKIKAELQQEWSTVINELASSRKTNENLKQTLSRLQTQYEEMQAAIETLKQRDAEARKVHAKQEALLDKALIELGVGVGE